MLQNVVEDRNLLEEGIDDERQKLEHSYAALPGVLTALDSPDSIYPKCTKFQYLTSLAILMAVCQILMVKSEPIAESYRR
ncbi:MAG: hypothetical protein KME31_29210 [Tolypothrix carrinoi HA7290-LM1]|nr:hypothetical protein [Tolypothrix carrinoi HA7290-LM1]